LFIAVDLKQLIFEGSYLPEHTGSFIITYMTVTKVAHIVDTMAC
jgi:hypothetical protein